MAIVPWSITGPMRPAASASSAVSGKDVKGKNWSQLSGHIAGNFLVTNAQGTMGRAAAFEHLQHMDLKSYSLAEVKTELHGDTFIVTYQLTLEGTMDEEPLPSQPLHVMTVWQHQSRSWVAIARSEF